MRHGSLFSGIGGFDLAAEWMGWENIFHCEWNPFGQRVLKYHFPKSISYEDITKTDFSIHRGSIDILSGGFPCQPYSSAGKRLGKEDERHLWPEMLRAIKEIQPRWIVGENVLGIVNWSGGLVFEEVQTDLENEGYKVQAYILPAVSVNAPHVRQRVFFIAYSDNTRNDISMRNRRERQEGNKGWQGQPFSEYRQDGSYGVATDSELNATRQNIRGDSEEKGDLRRGKESDVFGTFCGIGNATDTDGIGIGESREERFSEQPNENGNERRTTTDTDSFRLELSENGAEMGGGQGEMGSKRGQSTNAIETNGKIRNITNPDSKMLEHGYGEGETGGRANKKIRTEPFDSPGDWSAFPTVTPICVRNDGFSNRLDGITFPKWRNESIKAAGNAVVPQLILQLFKTIAEYERIANSEKNNG
jgi:DNA (cytosine-5)-methyltransferase 1